MKRMRVIFLWLISLCIPYFFIMTSVRALLTPAFLVVEYNMPGFPEDPYGFTQADRLHYGNISVKYLTNSADITFLSDVKMQDGTPLYNERELSHMLDVKNLVQATLKIWVAVGVILLLTIVAAAIGHWLPDVWRAFSRGGWLTLGVIVLILVGVALNFDALFTEFHHLFFTGDTWLFYYSDSLIRLFPIRFWQDAFIFMGVLTGAMSLIAGLWGRKASRSA
ncbi:MAG TPA: TIGR01906 family membrane protein [Bellilinea sp.]|nr:TIGR01906 family membrane protein [Bellilinea sp.]